MVWGWVIAVIVAVIVVVVVIDEIEDRAESHIVTVESFRVSGIILCSELYTSAEYSKCINEVQAEWTRALLEQEGFNTDNVPSIPADGWP